MKLFPIDPSKQPTYQGYAAADTIVWNRNRSVFRSVNGASHEAGQPRQDEIVMG